MKNLNDLKQKVGNYGFAKGKYGQASKDRFKRLEWIKLTRISDAGYGINRYHCNSNIGALLIYINKSGVGISSNFSNNAEFNLSRIVKPLIPPSLTELVTKTEREGEYLLLYDAKDFIQYSKFKSEQEYYDWWDKYQPKFLPRNPDDYYSMPSK